MNGFEMIMAIRSIDGLESVPVIFITAMSEKADKEKAIALGAADFLVKPFETEELLEKLRQYLI